MKRRKIVPGKKRLFIESEAVDAGKLSKAQRCVRQLLDDQGEIYPKEVFDRVQGFAWHFVEEAWDAVKWADEIYCDSSLVPLSGYGTYTGSPVVMNTMMINAIRENITGKSIIFLRPFADIDWDTINIELSEIAFAKNKLLTLEYENGYKLVETTVQQIIKHLKEH